MTFSSFYMAGFECADHINRRGVRADLLAITGHVEHVLEDYQNLLDIGISTVREGICWGLVERQPYVYDWSYVVPRLRAGRMSGIQQIWDICHFGFPDDLMPTHPSFVNRFCAVCESFAALWNKEGSGPLMVSPINEISFLSWHAGEMRGTVPFSTGQGFDLKYHLAKAAIAGIKELKALYPDTIVLTSEPLMLYVVPNDATEELRERAQKETSYQFQALDMILGRICPELGGSSDLIDIAGLNFYYDNQMYLYGNRVQWEHPQDPIWRPLSFMLQEVKYRYPLLPLYISETSHLGEGRAAWLVDLDGECKKAREMGVELLGICLYPAIDRPDWDDQTTFHNSGIWDLNPNCSTIDSRVPASDYIRTIQSLTFSS